MFFYGKQFCWLFSKIPPKFGCHKIEKNPLVVGYSKESDMPFFALRLTKLLHINFFLVPNYLCIPWHT